MESTEMPCRCTQSAAKMRVCIREHPGDAAMISLGVGVLLAQLPLRMLAAALARLVLLLLKPALIFYGLYRLAEDSYARCQDRHEP